MADKLPVEAISHMMRYLSVSDRKEAALVNKRWYEAAMDPILQQDIIITFQTPSMTEGPIIGFGKRRSPNLVLNHIDGSSHSKLVIQKACQYMGQHLNRLSLKGSDITEGTFMSIVQYCHNLVSLDLSCCNSLFMSGKFLSKPKDLEAVKAALVNLKELNLSSLRYLSDSLFNRIMTCVPNIEKLSLASCHLTFEFNPYRDSKYRNSESVLTFTSLLNSIEAHTKTLQSLDLSRTAITNDGICSLVNIKALQLRELSLKGCRDITDSGIAVLVKNQTSLTKLDLSSCQELKDGAIHAIRNNLVELQHLNINKCRYVTDSPIQLLCSTLPNLTYFNASECFQLTSKGLIKGLCGGSTSTLVSLNLSCCSLVKDDLVLAMSKVMINLEELDLGSCLPLTDKSVNIIAKSFGQLRSLRLAWCKEVTDYGLLGLEKYIYQDDLAERDDEVPNINQGVKMITPGKPNEYSSGRFSRNYSNIGMFSIPADGDRNPPKKISFSELEREIKKEEYTALYMIKGLQSLNLNACHRVTDLGIIQAIRFRELRKLNLSMCPKLTDDGLIAVSKNNKSLEELYISQCQKITDVGIIAVAKNLLRLAILDVSSSDQITDKSLQVLGKYCPQLRNLDVSTCGQITMEAVDAISQTLKYLTVQARYVGGSLEHELFSY
ncbi:uncharacterized protein LOC144438945 [Glandiceps talaboti]